ncbi:ankyrin repeat domain-containing protein [Rhizobacter sp. P5_C2]
MIKRSTRLTVTLLSWIAITACSPQNSNDLVWAASSGNLPRVKEMVSQKVNVNARAFDDGQTALIAAARNGRQDIVEFLVANGADVNLKDAAGTPLYWAAFAGQAASYDYLRAHGGRLNTDEAALAHLLRVLNEKGLSDLAVAVKTASAQEKG